MRITPLIVCLLLAPFCLNGQTFEWAESFGSTNYEYALSTATDGVGNIYTTGSFSETVDFDPGIGTYNLVSQGIGDIFIQKLDPSGNFVWAKSIGGIANDFGRDIKIDASGNVYVTGNFSYLNVDFNPGAGTNNLSSAGQVDVFVLKLDGNGNFLWAKGMGGTQDEIGFSINIDATGNCYTSGLFHTTVDFNPGTGTSNLTSAGYGDVFVQKMDANGNFLWAKGFGGTMNDESYSSCLDSFGNIYTTGYFQGTADFNPGAGTSNLNSTGITDVFVQKMDANGNFLWVKQIGGASYDYSFGLDVDPAGNVYTTGYFIGTTDFNPGAGVYNLSSAGNADVFIQKMNGSGNFIWAKRIGGAGYDYGNSLDVDSYGDVYITGQFEGTVDFDPGIGTNNVSSSGGIDAFVQKMNSAGTFLRAKTFGGSGTDQGNAIFVDNSANIIIAGRYQGTIDFDPSAGTSTATSAGNDDGFVEKMSQCYTSPGTDVITACDTYTWIDGITYTASNNTATLTLDASGCDQVITLNLTINYSSTATDIITACDSYTWIDGVTYTSSNNTATDTLTNAVGCDSVVTLNLTINQSNTVTDIITACNSYTWIDGITYTTSNNTATHTLSNSFGCDSIITLNLTIGNNTGIDILFSCDSLTWIDGITYYSSTNTPTWTLTNAAGCDSIVTLDLTIIPSEPTIIENMFSMPSDANNCLGEFAVDISGNTDFELDIDNGAQTATSNGYSLFTNLCPGVHDLQIVNSCGDTTETQFVIPVDSNYVFTNPFIDSLAQDSLGTTIENCDIYYTGIDTAYIDSIWATGNTVNVIWNIIDSNGSNLDTTTYELNNGNGVYYLQLSVFCPTKALGDYFTVTEVIYFEDGNISTAGVSEGYLDSFILYPNPANDLITISFEGNNAHYTIYDAQGKLIQTSSIVSGGTVSLKDVQTGVYFFELTTENGKTVKRVVKN